MANKDHFPVVTMGDIGGETVQTVNAREIHDFLMVGKDFSTWIKDRIQQYGFAENQDFTIVFPKSGENPQGGRPPKEYHASIDMAKELSMVERNEQGRKARRYFIQKEKEALAYQQGRSFRDPKVTDEKSKAIRFTTSIFKTSKSLAIAAGFKGNQAVLSANKATLKMTGTDCLALIGATHLEEKKQVRHFTPSDLGKRNDMSGRQFNQLLRKAGLQVEIRDAKNRVHWKHTKKGEPFAVLLDTGKKHSNGTPVQQLKWLESVIKAAEKAAQEPPATENDH